MLDVVSHFATDDVIAKYCSQHVCVSKSVCDSVYSCISKKSRVQISQKFLYVLHAAVAWSCSDDGATHYVLPVLWMTSCFHIMMHMHMQWHSGSSHRQATITPWLSDIDSLTAISKWFDWVAWRAAWLREGAKSAIFNCLVFSGVMFCHF